MIQTLVAALALGFVPGPADGGKDAEVPIANPGLVVGTWDLPKAFGGVETWHFRCDGTFTSTLVYPGERPIVTCSGTWRLDGHGLKLRHAGGPLTEEVLKLDRRVFVWEGDLRPERLRRRLHPGRP